MTARPLRIVARNHYGACSPLLEALARSGHQIVSGGAADVLLIDLDPPVFGYRELIDRYKALGATVLLYPHGVAPPVYYDGLFEPYVHVDGNLVIGAGNAELLRRMDYPTPTHAIGWSLCEQRPFRACRNVRQVLFAPMHPAGDGLPERYRAQNAATFRQLVDGPWDVTVRYIGTLEQNGLSPVDGVRFLPAQPEVSVAEIDEADAVVAANGTFPCLAVARGVPTVVYGQLQPAQYGIAGEPTIPLRRLDAYRDYLRYPFDVEDGPLDEVLHGAASSDEAIAEWRRRFIGEPFDDQAFVGLVERIVAGGSGPVQLDDLRSHVVAAFADELHERPELLAAYAGEYGADDDATLIVWGAGQQPDKLTATVQRAVAAAGLDEDELPDVLLLPHADLAAVDRCLAERVDALLSDWPTCGQLAELPRHELVQACS